MEIWEETIKIERLFDAGGIPGSEVGRPFPSLSEIWADLIQRLRLARLRWDCYGSSATG